MGQSKRYNGFKNYETWNVSLWIDNDEGFYLLARTCKNYKSFIETLREIDVIETPDKVAFNDSGLDLRTLNRLIKELSK